ncbi:hypothetical protein FNF29_01020 [Cafeteria roenbergensis]|uniref:RNA helicase n=1 Tax=Cafeteria roenbergensis TaxID=33653 RepID=A0A5A8CVL7_CAFRO|nr:hypothetical protein FNF29_01020 [Cafeteria roenbergensis]|eukprot:KAA0156230.1 hypothetical protein FNF29_01020 [Cafeteria roenbergensis]
MDLADELAFGDGFGEDALLGLDGLTSIAESSSSSSSAAAKPAVSGARSQKRAREEDSRGSKSGKGRKVRFGDPDSDEEDSDDGGAMERRRPRDGALPAKAAKTGPDDEFDATAARLRSVVESAGSAGDGKTTASGASKSGKGSFAGLGLSQPLLAGVNRMGYRLPTPIQRRTLPLTLGGRDVVAMARTGSGKTAAFLLPVLEKLGKHDPSAGGPRAIVLSPTREIATQTLRFARGLGRFTDLRCALLVGGDALEAQFEALATNPDVLIATPGRLMHLIAEVRDLSLAHVEALVFDEADRLFELGFAEQLEAILGKCPERRQTLLFSATLPRMLVQFARAGLREPELIRLDVETKVSDKLRMAFFRVRSEEKEAALLWLLRSLLPGKQQAMVFAATMQHVELLTAMLRSAGITVEPIYGQMEPEARKLAILRFRQRRTRVMVATDVAARGIDLPLLDNVINYNFPDKAKLFVHRCGRVARQGRGGCAFSLIAPPELAYAADVFAFLDRPMTASRAETQAAEAAREAELAAGFGGDVVEVSGAAKDASTPAPPGAESDEEEDPEDAATRREVEAEREARRLAKAKEAPRSSSAAAATAAAAAGSLSWNTHSSAGAHVAASKAASAAARDGYTLADMEASDVHHGRIPRALLQADIERIERWGLGAEALEVEALRKSAANGTKQYTRSCAEPSRTGIATARRVSAVHAVHPLALGLGHTETVAQEAAAGTLQAYRPNTTVFELEGGRKSHVKRQQAAAAMKALRRVNKGRLERDAEANKAADKAAALALGMLIARHHANEAGDEDGDDAAADVGSSSSAASRHASAAEAESAARGMVASGQLTALPSSSGPRMSVAERRRRKRAAQGGKGASLAHGGSAAGAAADEAAAANAHRSSAVKAARRRAVADATARLAAAAAVGGARKTTSASTGAFRDPSLYIASTIGEAVRATEAALDVHAGNRGAMAASNAAATGGLLGASAMEANVLDLVGDDAKAMSSQRKQFHWDTRKKKYVQLTAAEWAMRRGERKIKLADGTVVRGDGKEHGEAYSRWTRKSKRRVGALQEDGEGAADGVTAGGAPIVLSSQDFRAGRSRQHALAVSLGATAEQTKTASKEAQRRKRVEASGRGADDDVPLTAEDAEGLIKPGKAGASKPARRELRTEAEIRKARKQADDHKLRNMSKDKRRSIVSQQRAEALKKRADRRAKQSGRSKSLVITRR